MCGIAGFNLDPKFVADRPEADFASAVRLGWLHNRHRGTDAAGWIAKYSEPRDDSHTWYYKDGCDAMDLITTKTYPSGRPQALAAHCRASSRGSEKDNRNNHPVEYKGMLVTHNGTISNSDKLLKDWDVESHGIQVDSYVFPVAMDLFWENPEDSPDDFITALRDMYGSYAIVGMWSRYKPTLLVRGRNSPLIVAEKQDVGVLWGSEIDAVTAMIKTFGFDENSGWKIRRIEEGSILLVEDGNITKVVKYAPSKWVGHGNTSTPATMERRHVAFDMQMQDNGYFGGSKHWTYDVAPKTAWKNDDPKIKWVDPKDWEDALPVSLHSWVGDAFAIALGLDVNDKFTKTVDCRVYVLLGDPEKPVEVTANGLGTVKDIVYHGVEADRWIDLAEQPADATAATLDTISVEEKWSDPVIKFRSGVAVSPIYKGLKDSMQGEFWSSRKDSLGPLAGMLASGTNSGHTVYFYENHASVVLSTFKDCKQHNVPMTEHRSAWACKFWKASVLQAASWCDITELEEFFGAYLETEPMEERICKHDKGWIDHLTVRGVVLSSTCNACRVQYNVQSFATQEMEDLLGCSTILK